jgi:RND family efflux transporter MFP subunit
MRIYVRVPQGYSAAVHPGIAATLTLPEYPGRTFPASVTRTAQAVDAQSGAVLVELQADNPDGALKPGAYAQVSFRTGAGQGNSVSVPGSAILYGNNGPTVAVVDDKGTVAVKPVTIGRDDGATVVISGGISTHDRVIDSPPDSIRTGDHVKVHKASAGAAKGGANGK